MRFSKRSLVLSKPETQQVFEKLREREQKEASYELAARQYAAGLRLSELVRLRVQDVDPSTATPGQEWDAGR